jgi:surfeit locus 1 family protein
MEPRRRLFWPALTTVLMLAITLGLGVWQVQRLAWKTALLASIDRAEASPVLPLTGTPLPFHRYSASGHFSAQEARYGAEVRQGAAGPVMGEQLIEVLLRPGELPLVVDRGWVPDDAELPPETGIVNVIGYVRDPEPHSWLAAQDNTTTKRFYSLDPAVIGAALGFPSVSPFTLVALGPAGSIPDPVQALPRPPNDHLSYAITWFSLSAALVVVFIIYARQARARRP